MSSFIRRIQNSAKRKLKHPFLGRGFKLGVRNPDAKDRLAREAREKVRTAE